MFVSRCVKCRISRRCAQRWDLWTKIMMLPGVPVPEEVFEENNFTGFFLRSFASAPGLFNVEPVASGDHLRIMIDLKFFLRVKAGRLLALDSMTNGPVVARELSSDAGGWGFRRALD